MRDRPIDPVTVTEAARILGVSSYTVYRYAKRGLLKHSPYGRLSRADVEELASRIYRWSMHLHDTSSYWVTSGAAAAILGVSKAGLAGMAEADRVPFVMHVSGVRLYRREQVAVMGASRRGPTR